MKRKIIKIDADLCNGCGDCVSGCPEGAIQLIDGKARLVGDLFCDGLGACIGECPVQAIAIEEREAEAYDERRVMQNIVLQGERTIEAHLRHLRDHGESAYLEEALACLRDEGLPVPDAFARPQTAAADPGEAPCCPGLRAFSFRSATGAGAAAASQAAAQPSELRQWPVQLHLVPPGAPYFQGSDVLLAADCTAFSAGDFHSRFLRGKALAIACPKLDQGTERYVEKIRLMIDQARINTLTVLKMHVPCCAGLLHIALEARDTAERRIPVKSLTIDPEGTILEESWL